MKKKIKYDPLWPGFEDLDKPLNIKETEHDNKVKKAAEFVAKNIKRVLDKLK